MFSSVFCCEVVEQEIGKSEKNVKCSILVNAMKKLEKEICHRILEKYGVLELPALPKTNIIPFFISLSPDNHPVVAVIKELEQFLKGKPKDPEVIIREMGNRISTSNSEHVIIVDYSNSQSIEPICIKVPKDLILIQIVECKKPEESYFQFEISIQKSKFEQGDELEAIIPARSFFREWQGENYYYSKSFSEKFACFLYKLKKFGGIINLGKSSEYSSTPLKDPEGSDPYIAGGGGRKYIDCKEKKVYDLDDFIGNLNLNCE